MQGLLPAGWLAFAGRELNPLDHVERFQIIFSSPSPGFFLAQRTAGFPQYGWKAGLSGGPSRIINQLKPAPGMRWLTTSLSSPFVHRVVTTVVPLCVGPRTRLCTAIVGDYPTAPEALARVRVVLSRSVIT